MVITVALRSTRLFPRLWLARSSPASSQSPTLPPYAGEEEEEEAEEEVVAEDIFELEGMLASELDINAGPEELAQRSAVLAMRRHGPTPDSRGGWEGALPGSQGQAQKQQQQQSQPSTRPPVDEMANKLDSMMELAFEHLGKRIAAGAEHRQSAGVVATAVRVARPSWDGANVPSNRA